MVGIVLGRFAFAGAGIDSIAAAQRGAYVHCLAESHVRCVFEFNTSTLVTREVVCGFCWLSPSYAHPGGGQTLPGPP
jgi:hypothetical protein